MSEKIIGAEEQKVGGFHDTDSKKCFDSTEEAKSNYTALRDRFFNFNEWHTYAGELTATFIHYNAKGQEIQRSPEVGDFLKIDIPGPGSTAGKGFDWVKITKIDEKPYDNDARCLIVCVPSINPLADYVEDVAHFYSDKASSNFVIRRIGNCLYAEIHGRNEVGNVKTKNIPDQIRNAVVSLMGRAGLAKIQWKNLANGLLQF